MSLVQISDYITQSSARCLTTFAQSCFYDYTHGQGYLATYSVTFRCLVRYASNGGRTVSNCRGASNNRDVSNRTSYSNIPQSSV
jgi:hypothetical protein